MGRNLGGGLVEDSLLRGFGLARALKLLAELVVRRVQDEADLEFADSFVVFTPIDIDIALVDPGGNLLPIRGRVPRCLSSRSRSCSVCGRSFRSGPGHVRWQRCVGRRFWGDWAERAEMPEAAGKTGQKDGGRRPRDPARQPGGCGRAAAGNQEGELLRA